MGDVPAVPTGPTGLDEAEDAAAYSGELQAALGKIKIFQLEVQGAGRVIQGSNI